jgi:hypothetical protein
MLDWLLNTVFGCSHAHITFPITPGRKPSAAGIHRHGTYVACLDCGQEFSYDWNEMRVGEPVGARSYASATESFSHANH